jgi:hypothetical protein
MEQDLIYVRECVLKGGILVEGAIVGAFDSVINKRSKADTNNNLLEEIENVKMRLDTAASHFESQSDPDLIEASIYEMKSLSARYRYLMREAKRTGVTKSINNILEHTGHF